MGHLRTLIFTLCKCDPVEHEGAKSGLRPENKVCREKVAHSPRILETSQRLVVFELFMV